MLVALKMKDGETLCGRVKVVSSHKRMQKGLEIEQLVNLM